MIGKIPREEIAERMGVSLSNLKRAFRGTRLAFHNYCVRQPELVRAVNRHYEKHGRARTAERFGLKPKQVEHIIYRYKMHRPRQVRWTKEQVIELCRMGGLISFASQAKYFNRPRANAGAIKSAWVKKFKMSGGSINGMSHVEARHLVTKSCPFVRTRFWSQRKVSGEYGRMLYLWVDMEKHLRAECPDFIREAISTLANFQRWLHGNQRPQRKIRTMIERRDP